MAFAESSKELFWLSELANSPFFGEKSRCVVFLMLRVDAEQPSELNASPGVFRGIENKVKVLLGSNSDVFLCKVIYFQGILVWLVDVRDEAAQVDLAEGIWDFSESIFDDHGHLREIMSFLNRRYNNRVG
jgi:hypothetical protein